MRTPPSPYAIALRDSPPEGLPLAYDLTGAFTENTFEGSEVDASRSTVSAELDLYRTGHEVVARGALAGDLATICSRCTDDARVALDAPVEVVFVPRGTEIAATDEDDGDIAAAPEIVHYDDETIDLSETLREELLLALPLAPLCREDCKGLCARCGKELNAGPCDCPEEPKDDRWSALRNVKLD